MEPWWYNPAGGSGGNLYTAKEYGDFEYRFEFQLTPGANNGLGIRTPTEGDAAYVGMELQILDNEADIYKNLNVYQYHGSVYGVIPAKRGFLKPVGEWNEEVVVAKGSKIKVILNGQVIMDGDIKEASKNGTADHKDHPGTPQSQGPYWIPWPRISCSVPEYQGEDIVNLSAYAQVHSFFFVGFKSVSWIFSKHHRRMDQES